MSDEIKEILDFKENADYKKLSVDEIVILKNYITNIQEEVNKLTAESTEWESKYYDLQEENERLKYWLNDVIFDENNIDVELPARYLRKLGYIDFDDKKKVYINKHNNSPFIQEDSKEKAFYLKDEELNEYTQQLESQNEDYQQRNEKAIEYIKEHQRKDEFLNLNEWQTRELLNILKGDKDE